MSRFLRPFICHTNCYGNIVEWAIIGKNVGEKFILAEGQVNGHKAHNGLVQRKFQLSKRTGKCKCPYFAFLKP